MLEKLQNELIELAQEIVSLNSFDNVDDLKKKSQQLNNKINLLSFVNKNPEALKNYSQLIVDELLLEKEQQLLASKIDEKPIITEAELKEFNNPVMVEDELIPLFEPTFEGVKDDFSVKKEFEDTVSLDDTKDLFKTKKKEVKQLSLHDKLLTNSIQVGLNDRIAFVNSLFNFNQKEFNDTLDSLNAFSSKEDAFEYIQNKIKPKYNWSDKEEIEERFLALIERKFL